MRGLTQNELGQILGLPAFRIGQYETDIRTPKETQLIEIANALGTPVEFFQNRHIDTYLDLMHALFELEKIFDLSVTKSDNGRYVLRFENQVINSYLEDWFKEKGKSIESANTKANYEEWKITFPNKRIEKMTDKLDKVRNKNNE